MAGEKVVYDAKAAEDALTRMRMAFQGGGPHPQDDAMAAVHAVSVFAQVAQANALERIAKALESLLEGQVHAHLTGKDSSAAKHAHK